MTMPLTRESKLREIYDTPVGHDVLSKILLQLNVPIGVLTNPIVGSLKLKTLEKWSKSKLPSSFFDALLHLLNQEQDRPRCDDAPIQKAPWKEAIVYQIYPRSFCDSNGDGIGDLNGIRQKLDYLKDLGVDYVWLSPIYDSPNDDNGYDIRNYDQIMQEFGTMEDFDALLEEIHARGMKLIMDLVVNHTSDEHPWFQDALHTPDSPYEKYYKFASSSSDTPPNNWTSFFRGRAWNYYPEKDKWALHLFSKKQMDLNWDYAPMRQEIYAMINRWLEKGVDGFRLDVINYISKDEGLPNGDDVIGELMGFYGIEHYFYGPHLHEYLKEMRAETFDKYGAVTVGETPGVGMEMSKLLTADYRKELDMVFSFDHLETPGHVRFDEYQYDLNYLKSYYIDWMEHFGPHCWMSLFYENHDNPRMISKVNPNPAYREVLGKLLALIQLTLRGTPFIFQGQELGRINQNFSSIEEMSDIESLNHYHDWLEDYTPQEAFQKVLAGSRDHARTPMAWDDSLHGGFSSATPWIVGDTDYKTCNVASEEQNPNSVLQFYRALIALRKENHALIYGDFQALHPHRKDLFTYTRTLDGTTFCIECNLSDKPIRRQDSLKHYKRILSNYKEGASMLRPYEATIYRKD